MTFPFQSTSPLAAGAISFASYFIRGEHHMYILRYLQGLAVITISAAVVLVYHWQWQPGTAASLVAQIVARYLVGLFATRLLYRLLLHPLNKFPGPFGARLTSFWFSWGLRKSDCFRQLHKLHQDHGSILRIGPNNLSIIHPEAVPAIYGYDSKCTKAPWYDLTHPMVSLQTFRNTLLHDQRRQVWSAAFGNKMLRGYEQRLRRYRQKLINHIDQSGGAPVNVTKWFNLYSFDIMDDLAFGQSFDMLENGEHWAIKLLSEALVPLAFAFPVWFFRLLTAVPGLTKDWWRFIDFCAQRMEQRLATKVDVPDIVSALSTGMQNPEKPTVGEMHLLRGDAQLIVVAGSDTTATTLTAALWELAQRVEQMEMLRQEVRPFMTEPNRESLNEKIGALPHLNAFINETLRLHPRVPSMLQRKTPPEGLIIHDEFIPGNTIVSCPQYVIGWSPAACSAEQFIPERWTSRSEFVKEPRAFAPFSTGPYSCIGRPLALLNIRTMLARLVTQYDIHFATGEDGSTFESNAREKFTMGFGDLFLSFRKKQETQSE